MFQKDINVQNELKKKKREKKRRNKLSCPLEREVYIIKIQELNFCLGKEKIKLSTTGNIWIAPIITKFYILIVFAFLLFCLSCWTAISLLPAALWPLLTSAQRALLSYTCLQDCVIFPACTNTSKWRSLLRWRTWLTSCLFATISPSPSMCLSCKCSKSLPPSCFT